MNILVWANVCAVIYVKLNVSDDCGTKNNLFVSLHQITS